VVGAAFGFALVPILCALVGRTLYGTEIAPVRIQHSQWTMLNQESLIFYCNYQNQKHAKSRST